MAQMQTISIRVPDEDFQWLLTLQDGGAKTPSEKLRALLSRARQQEAGMAHYSLCSGWMRALAQPFADSVASLERKHKIHSDLIAAVTEWVPQMMAILIAERPAGDRALEEAAEIEAMLAQQSFRLLTALLRSAVTSGPSTYDREVLDRFLPDFIEIASIIDARTGKESNHG